MEFLDFKGLSEFFTGLFGKFATLSHKHKVADISDYTVDSSLSSSSTNPIQNKAVNSALSGKVPTSRTINGKALTSNISLTATDVGADASGNAESKVGIHNTSNSSHNDIRDLIVGLNSRLNALADSDDSTLDQLSEIVAYIKSNKTLIDSITTSKVSVSDIVDNLTTSSPSKVLSAKQGVAIKSLIDALDSELDNHTHDGRYYTESEIDVKLSNKTSIVVSYTEPTDDTDFWLKKY